MTQMINLSHTKNTVSIENQTHIVFIYTLDMVVIFFIIVILVATFATVHTDFLFFDKCATLQLYNTHVNPIRSYEIVLK